MSPATAPRVWREAQRLFVADPVTGAVVHDTIAGLPNWLRPGDVFVVNDAATLPASLSMKTPGEAAVEVRLASFDPPAATAVLFGDGSWRDRTEDRGRAPPMNVGDRLTALTAPSGSPALTAEITAVLATSAGSPRLVTLRFDRSADALIAALYAAGEPIRYSYLDAPTRLWDVQNVFSSRPWAVEPPSAALGLTWSTLLAIRRRGVRVARLTHAAGLSSTGDAELDARLPFSERYEIPEATARLVAEARAARRRVIAVGTTVVRALESAAASGAIVPGAGVATRVLRPGDALRVVDGVLSGMHGPGESHFELLGAFASSERLAQWTREAERHGYLQHEFGDACLVLREHEARSAPGSNAGGVTDATSAP